MEQRPSSSRQLMQCFCVICRGRKWWSKSTVYEHLNDQVVENVSHEMPSEIWNNPISEREREDIDMGEVEETNVQEGEDNDMEANIEEDEDNNMEANIRCSQGSQSERVASQVLSLEEAITCRVVELQSMWDEAHVPTRVQGHILHELFGSLQKEPKVLEDGSVDHSGLSLGKLLTLVGPTWKGELSDLHAPTSWNELKKFYSNLGLVEAQRWRLCTGSNEAPHSPKLLEPSEEDIYEGSETMKCKCLPKKKILKRDCEDCSEKCPICKKMRKTILAFEYMPIPQVLQSLCKSRTICHKLLTTWRNKDKWLGNDPSTIPDKIEENFDGSKFRELQAFFNPRGEWEAPVICPNKKCLHAFRAFPTKCTELQNLKNWDEGSNQYSFPCSTCSSRICVSRKIKKRDPRNFALMLHWDGFSTAKTSMKNCWVVNLLVLNAEKTDPIGPIPILFIPASSEKLIRSGDGVLTSFVHPLIADLESIFVHGFKVIYNYPVQEISEFLRIVPINEPIECRAVLSIWTGDHPGQTKIGGWKLGGYAGCRRHKLPSRWRGIPNTNKGLVEYYDNRKQYRHPPIVRTVESTAISLVHWQELPYGREKDAVGLEAGISGYSSLWRLHNLYGFDLVKDLVYDVMHILALCIFKKYVHLLVKYAKEFGKTKDVDIAMATVKKLRPIGFGARWPRNLSSLGYYKAEEYQIFILWCLLQILDQLNLGSRSVLGSTGMLLTEIGRLFYSHSRRHGWTTQAMQNARQLLAAWHIRMEESAGPNSSPLEHVAGSGELLDDIIRHGAHDVFWCYSFEREVSNIVNIPTNQGNSEVTYSDYFSRYWFTKIYKNVQVEYDGLSPESRALVEIHKYLQPSTNARRIELLHSSVICQHWHGSCVVVVPSQDVAREIWNLISKLKPCFCKDLIMRKGILIGRKKGLDSNISETKRSYLEMYWGHHAGFNQELLPFFSPSIQICSSILLHGQVYRVEDSVVIEPEVTYSSHSWTRKAKVKEFFIHEFQNIKQAFFQGKYYVTVPESSSTTLAREDELTGMRVIQEHQNMQEWSDYDVRPVEQIMFKFIPLPICGQNDAVFVAYELEDIVPRDHLFKLGMPGCVPPYPEKGDVVLARDTNWTRDKPTFSIAVVRNVRAQKYLSDEATIERTKRKDIAASPQLQEQDYFVGDVELEWLKAIGKPTTGRPQKYKNLGFTSTKSWHSLEKLLPHFQVTRISNSEPIEWMYHIDN